MKSSPIPQDRKQDPRVQGFEYPTSGIESPISCMEWQKETVRDPLKVSAADRNSSISAESSEPGQMLEMKEPAAEFERGHILGFIEGQAAERATLRDELRNLEAEKIEHALRLNEQFASERERYLKSVGPELVELAVAIASLILRREVQVDPLMLTNSVRIALREVAANTSVKIHVPVLSSDLWLETVDHLPNLGVKPTIVAEEELQDGECTIETEMGSADLGVQSQLAEIARLLLNPSSPGKDDGPIKRAEVMHP